MDSEKKLNQLTDIFVLPTENRLKPSKFEKTHGLHWIVTAFFLVGNIAGAGFVALPTALVQAQFWPGLFLVILTSLIGAYCAYVLGESWVILQKRWPDYRQHCRKPYAEMGFRAMGSEIKTIVSVCISATQFGVTVVYLLLCAKNIHDSVAAFSGYNFNFCLVILILALLLLPVTYLKSPEDFWWTVILAMVSSAVAAILICVGGAKDYETCHSHRKLPDFYFTQYSLGLSIFICAFGGHAAFPTIQHDMRKPSEFKKSVALAFSMLHMLYLPVGTIGYIVYGDALRDSVINAIQTVWIQQALNILITAHCILAMTCVLNPLNQEAEEFFDVPHHFCIQRIVVRTAILFFAVFVAESIPSFGPIMNLLGGSSLMLTSLVFPCLFYMYLLTSQKKKEDGEKNADEIPTFAEWVFAYRLKEFFV
ncbi:hypothetical protein L596_011520 [Steinernema carpocapsae]|uniref:Amino acid transporter transmembrane domain-containing protein n=1 Tax=Steinernema carpocapsae TaxID=34508 RepID=A0A4U5NU66_STECR|nr:hypothetical protein L596_011520 [Steinernema carpocapsae]